MKCELCLLSINSSHRVVLMTKHATYDDVCQLCVQNGYHRELLHALEQAKAHFERVRADYHSAAGRTGVFIRFFNDINAMSISDTGIEYSF